VGVEGWVLKAGEWVWETAGQAEASGLLPRTPSLLPALLAFSAGSNPLPAPTLCPARIAGVSDTAVKLADACAVVPMVGFVESFNISGEG